MKKYAVRNRKREKLVLVFIVLILAIGVSFTLAWSLQDLHSPDNRVSAMKDNKHYIELWAQTPEGSGADKGGLYGNVFQPVTAFTTAASASPKVLDGYAEQVEVTDALTQMSAFQVVPDTLFPVVRSEPDPKNNDVLVYKNNDKTANPNDYNRLLNDAGFLPSNTITRRFVVRNTGGVPMSYDLSFAVAYGTDGTTPEDVTKMLAEAVEVTTYRVTDQAKAVAPATADMDTAALLTVGREKIAGLSGIGGEQLAARRTNGRLGAATRTDGSFEDGACAIYEMSFRFADMATVIYAEKEFQVDIAVKAQGIVPAHYVNTAEELQALLANANNAALTETDTGYFAPGDTICLTNDITLDSDFRMTKPFHLQLAGHTLRVTGKLVLLEPTDSANPGVFGVMDIGMNDTGKLLVGTGTIENTVGDPTQILLWAPNTAVRWNDATGSTLPLAGTMNLRRFNGAPAAQPTLDTTGW